MSKTEPARFYTYILECADGTFYTGYTTNPAHRVKTHNEKKGAKYTRNRLPVRLIYLEIHDSKHDAMSREFSIKQLSRKQKEQLIQSNLNRLENWTKETNSEQKES